jgi:hypothetical protein
VRVWLKQELAIWLRENRWELDVFIFAGSAESFAYEENAVEIID